MARIITTAIIKGGCGKTTTAAILAQAAAYLGKRVLCVDMDPQANLSRTLAADMTAGTGTADLINDGDPATLIQHTPQRVDVIPAQQRLVTERTKAGTGKRLRDALAKLPPVYDFIFIDTPPMMCELTINALHAAEELIVPIDAEVNALQGLYQVHDFVEQIRALSNPDLKISGVIVTKYDRRPRISRYLRDQIEKVCEEMKIPYLGEVRTSCAIPEAAAFQRSIYEYAPKSNPATDYLAIYNKLNGG